MDTKPALDRVLTFRTDEDTENALRAAAVLEHVTPSRLVRDAVRERALQVLRRAPARLERRDRRSA